ncbi:MAG TPA: hypothetical protein VG389_13760, partial [Myxococcota bacterium]|nr:hypothetical protein [Myxococcota bacterium]
MPSQDQMHTRIRDVVHRARRRLNRLAAEQKLAYCLSYGVPLAAAALAADYGFRFFEYGAPVAAAVLGATFVAWVAWALVGRTGNVPAAKRLDDELGLKDRIVSAYQFLDAGHTDGAHRLALDDALARAEEIKVGRVIARTRPAVAWLPMAALALFSAGSLIAGWWMTPPGSRAAVEAAKVAASIDAAKKEVSMLRADMDKLIDYATKMGWEPKAIEALKDAKTKLDDIAKKLEDEHADKSDVLKALSDMEKDLRDVAGKVSGDGLVTEERLKKLAEAAKALEADAHLAPVGKPLGDAAASALASGDGKLDDKKLAEA